jgi:hypothetical protein
VRYPLAATEYEHTHYHYENREDVYLVQSELLLPIASNLVSRIVSCSQGHSLRFIKEGSAWFSDESQAM